MSSPLAPVGIFDSGVGGLTVARAIIDQLPDEDIIYVGDTGNGPYGPLNIPEIRAHALAIGDDLVERGVKALVIASNSASSACLRDARERYDVPVVEVILPAVRRAVDTTRNGRIGVIGTAATISHPLRVKNPNTIRNVSQPKISPDAPMWLVSTPGGAPVLPISQVPKPPRIHTIAVA